jgi:hypothetical protein
MIDRSRILAAAACLLGSAGCVELGTPGNDPNATYQLQNPPPSGTTFKPVAVFLDRRCGSLDCHGQVGRNMRLYGQFGLRYSSMDTPGGNMITADEITQDWEAIVYLEPEIMDQVVGLGEMNPAQLDPTPLTFYRKPTGMEAHKGGMLIQPPTQTQPGDDQDTCIRSWLVNQLDTMACQRANEVALYP